MRRNVLVSTLLGACAMLAPGCRDHTPAPTPEPPAASAPQPAPARTTPPSPGAAAKPSASSASTLDPPPEPEPEPEPASGLSPDEESAVRDRFPNALVQSAVPIHLKARDETWAVVWAEPPEEEARCPSPNMRSGWDLQSCGGFDGNRVGDAHVLRLAAGKIVDTLAIGPTFFMHDDNPHSVEIDGGRGPRGLSYLPSSFGLELHDLDGDGVRAEFLLHTGNGPYGQIAYHVAVGLVGGRLGALKDAAGKRIVSTADAWHDLERTGTGEWEYQCGARCGNTAERHVLERKGPGRIVETDYWHCVMMGDGKWRKGPQTQECKFP